MAIQPSDNNLEHFYSKPKQAKGRLQKKKNGLFNDIDQIAFNTYQPLGRFENAKFLKIILEHVDLAVIHKK